MKNFHKLPLERQKGFLEGERLQVSDEFCEWLVTVDNSPRKRIVIPFDRFKATGKMYGDIKSLGQEMQEFRFKNGIRVYFAW